MAAEEQSAKTEDQAPEKSGGGNMAVLGLIALNVIAMGLCGYLSYMGTLGMSIQPEREDDAKKLLFDEKLFDHKPVIFSLEPFTVNLADVDDERIVQVQVTLEMLNETGFEEVVSMGAYARDTIVQILNGKRFDELQTIQGKLFLKDEITVALNQQLQRSFIKDIYFSRFVFQ